MQTETITNAPLPATEPAKAPAPLPPSVSDSLRQLMEKEKHVREAEAALRTREHAVTEAEALRRLAQESPLEAVARLGADPQTIAKLVAEGKTGRDPNEELRREFRTLQEQLKAREAREEEARRQAVVRDAQAGISKWVEGAGEQFPLTARAGASDLVWAQIERHYQATGQIQSEAEAASEVEAYLSGLLDRVLKDDSIRTKFLGSGAQEPKTNPVTVTSSAVASNGDVTDLAALPFSKALAAVTARLKQK